MPDYKEFPLADTAEGLTEAEIVNWHVAPGDEVTVNQIVVEVETAKATVELPCPWAGVITELHAAPGDVVEVGNRLLTMDLDPNGAPAARAPAAGAPAAGAPAAGAPAAEAGAGGDAGDADEQEMKPLVGYGSKATVAKRRPRKAAEPARSNGNGQEAAPAHANAAAAAGDVPLAKPPVRRLAKDMGVDLREVIGSGDNGVITREDVQRAGNGDGGAAAAPQGTRTEGALAPDAGAAQDAAAADSGVEAPAGAGLLSGGERRVPVKGVRKHTAQAMVQSAFTAPHVTEFLTVDVTPMMELRQRLKDSPEFAGVKLTPMTFAAKAMCMAIRRTPDVNASWDEDNREIVYKDYVHLGVAAATPRGLVVPKVRNAHALSLGGLAGELEQLTLTARDGKTAPEDMTGGTITLSNVGVFGVDSGTPILNPGETAILAFGSIRDTPWVVDGEIVPRKVCQLSLSFDHRVVDGQQGSQYLADVGALLADPMRAFLM